jgi:hypothetical protein
MNKKLKESFNRHKNTLYNQEWIEKAADEGYEKFLKCFNDSISDPKLRISKDNSRFAVIYYAAFEDAMNTFYRQALDDHMTELEFYFDELEKVTAKLYQSIKKK